jgi:hypothetical protein
MSKPPAEEKKPYSPPHLVEYGPVTKLTNAKSGTRTDGMEMMQKETGMGMN